MNSRIIINLDDFNHIDDMDNFYGWNDKHYEHKLDKGFGLMVYENESGVQVVKECGDDWYDIHLFTNESDSDTILFGDFYNYMKGEK